MVEQLAMACKRLKTGKANFADSSTGSAEQRAEQWSIWEAEEQVLVPTVKLTHTRPLPLDDSRRSYTWIRLPRSLPRAWSVEDSLPFDAQPSTEIV